MSWIIEEQALAQWMAEDGIAAVMSVGNGRFCTRAAAADAFATPAAPYPFRGTYPAGLYTKAGGGLDYPFTAPDWTAMAVMLENRPVFPVSRQRTLNMQNGILSTKSSFNAGTCSIETLEERFISWAHPNLGAQRITVTCKNPPPASIKILAGIDGKVHSSPSKLYKPGQPPNCSEKGVRLTRVVKNTTRNGLYKIILCARSTGNHSAAIGTLHTLSGNIEIQPAELPDFSGAMLKLYPGNTSTWCFEKICMISADMPGFEKADEAPRRENELAHKTFETALQEHLAAINRFWQTADVMIDGDAFAQEAVRYAIWSTRIAAGMDNGGSSIAPKNLTGDWYRGGVFWDMDMYQLPLLAALCPERAVNHIRYRFNRLSGARRLAAQDGYEGARFPFTSFDEGIEWPPYIRGTAGQQLHINADIPWGILYTHAITGDDEMLFKWGLPILIEQCRFWLSYIGEPDENGKFHIRNICGPDELHSGVDDNTYTNTLTAWILRKTCKLIEQMMLKYPQETAALTGESHAAPNAEEMLFGPEQRARAIAVAENIFLPRLPDGRPAQFAGFEKLPEPNAAIRNVWGAGDNTNKQADSLVLAQAIPGEIDEAWLAAVYDHDVPLCTQTSSLSPGTHVAAARRLRRKQDAERFWNLAAGIDLQDSFGNTAHGVHGAGQGAVWIAAVHGFGGLQLKPQGIEFSPLLPDKWQKMQYTVLYHGVPLALTITQNEFTITNKGHSSVRVRTGEKWTELAGQTSKTVPISEKWEATRFKALIIEATVFAKMIRSDDGMQHLNSLREKKRLLAVATKETDLPEEITAGGYKSCVDVVIDGNCIKLPPPDPEMLLLAAARCRALPWECLCIAESAEMQAAAKASGCVIMPYDNNCLTNERLETFFACNENPVNPYLALNIAKMKTELAN